ncbi:hypothetical protein [Flammeovirga aprica]|uniref:Uncharacterized protein n=1 Tax=Flammeovirga aprica JL-4 TaxID=694437 RepID=A0A7X9S003_9BACT|nr:hypothetical protein [Flammeovirga aprica]NME71809.1 hypothetical protein [Flammeovirga aprica JL-4]
MGLSFNAETVRDDLPKLVNKLKSDIEKDEVGFRKELNHHSKAILNNMIADPNDWNITTLMLDKLGNKLFNFAFNPEDIDNIDNREFLFSILYLFYSEFNLKKNKQLSGDAALNLEAFVAQNSTSLGERANNLIKQYQLILPALIFKETFNDSTINGIIDYKERLIDSERTLEKLDSKLKKREEKIQELDDALKEKEIAFNFVVTTHRH